MTEAPPLERVSGKSLLRANDAQFSVLLSAVVKEDRDGVSKVMSIADDLPKERRYAVSDAFAVLGRSAIENMIPYIGGPAAQSSIATSTLIKIGLESVVPLIRICIQQPGLGGSSASHALLTIASHVDLDRESESKSWDTRVQALLLLAYAYPDRPSVLDRLKRESVGTSSPELQQLVDWVMDR